MRTRFILLAVMLLSQPLHANDAAKVVGTWKLVSFENEFQDGSAARGAYGNRPTGYVVFTPEGRVMFMVEAEGRKAPENDEQRAAAFRTIIAYTGLYRLEGDKFITKVDVSWNPAWVGTEQVRDYRLDAFARKPIEASPAIRLRPLHSMDQTTNLPRKSPSASFSEKARSRRSLSAGSASAT